MQLVAFDVDAALAAEDEAAMMEIASESAALKEAFAELNTLTEAQTEPLQTIASKVESTVEDSEKGKKEVIEAARNAQEVRKKKLILFLIIVTVIVILVVIGIVFVVLFVCTPRGLDACKPAPKEDDKKRLLLRLLM